MSSRVSKKAPFDPDRQLMIKVKSCQRLAKENTYYKKEVQENESKLSKMKSESADPYDIKKFEEVLGESYMMVPDSEARLNKSLEDLSIFLDKHSDELDQNEEWFATGKDILSKHSAINKVNRTDDVDETNVDGLTEGESF
mmetsp:Transcript_24149/g.35296  ORF Transcript_24149/g.35296 Transcript_24149/m.35296 type:complete len:141 (+) Transcript_24149:121-543(+)|eukprot:CAMPEP_0195519022 /NCGR_PEP_ID=MMETSP0794_2-20130614/14201_1 /TAXON_ID=515487 /ORGANISM="Stephanopyxis turris, Strain CCMP 815" /LENGTH=140 /DNA_ID=CAMNT_0040648097 /DNA_START=105 /DNA_END=527 /DNA_ORIENTATION=+